MKVFPGRRCVVLAASLPLLAACRDGAGPAVPSVDEEAFVQMARQSNCADLRNRLYVIDQMLVLSDQAGACADAGYSRVLYGRHITDVYCTNRDSIAGPVSRCDAVEYQAMFDTIIAHLSEADLGLGATHTVKTLLR